MHKQWTSVGLPLIKGILGTSANYGSAASLGFRIVGTLQGIYALQVIIDNVHDEVFKKLTQVDQDSLTMSLILENHVRMKAETARNVSLKLQARRADVTSVVCLASLEESGNACNEITEAIRSYEKKYEKVSMFLSKFLDAYMSMEKSFQQSVNMIVKSVADRIADHLVRIIDTQLVSPWSTLAVSSMTSSLSQRIQHHCLVDKNQNTEELNADQEK